MINLGLLILSTLALMTMRDWICKLHAKLFGTDEKSLPLLYMQYISGFKLLVIFFNLVPYIALKLMA